MPYIRVYQPPKPKKPRTHPGLASLVAALAVALAGDVARAGWGTGDVAVSFGVAWLMYAFYKFL